MIEMYCIITEMYYNNVSSIINDGLGGVLYFLKKSYKQIKIKIVINAHENV